MINSIKVPTSAVLALRQQIEYYFSLNNLTTDGFLTNLINSNQGGWVQTKVLFKFNNIQNIFSSFFNKTVTGKQKRAILRKACESSPMFETTLFTIRSKHTVINNTSFQQVLYF